MRPSDLARVLGRLVDCGRDVSAQAARTSGITTMDRASFMIGIFVSRSHQALFRRRHWRGVKRHLIIRHVLAGLEFDLGV